MVSLKEGAPMASILQEPTNANLLGRVRRDAVDQAAWSEFAGRYGRQVFEWCRQWKLQEADALDVTQTVLTKLAQKMSSFAYDPGRSFRAYLKTLTRYACCDFLESRKRPGTGDGGSQVLEQLATLEAPDDQLHQLYTECDQELLQEAMSRVRARIQPHTWEAFRLTALEERPGAEVAERLQIKVATVFKAKSKVVKMLQEEIAGATTA
jgi:RNA polymerase sigma-70 factor (ECF subfamily)